MDGFETCRRLKQQDAAKEIPVIFMTALDDTSNKVKGFQAGGVDYITKPFQVEEVLARVETHLSLRNLQKNLQEEILRRKQAEEELREASASKDKFFSIVAHDLRNPFNGLMVLTEVLVENFESYEKEKLKAMLSRLHQSSENVYALLTNLLEWSQLERGLIMCYPETISLSDIAERAILVFTLQAKHKQITLRNLVPTDMTTYADEKMIGTVIRNLLSNALKFTDTGGTIELSGTQNEDVVEITVADTGIGISEEHIEELFRIDAKYQRTGTGGETGTGLGLSLCKELVEKNGGSIHVESEVGKGSRFTVVFPGSSSLNGL